MTQNCSLLWHKGNFPGKSKNNETTEICLKYSLTCAGASISKRYLKNNRLSPKIMVKKSESENLSISLLVMLFLVSISNLYTLCLYGPTYSLGEGTQLHNLEALPHQVHAKLVAILHLCNGRTSLCIYSQQHQRNLGNSLQIHSSLANLQCF